MLLVLLVALVLLVLLAVLLNVLRSFWKTSFIYARPCFRKIMECGDLLSAVRMCLMPSPEVVRCTYISEDSDEE